ncbi:MAG: LysR family transcriptional regulator [Pseudonocardia sediminis]
MAPDLTRLRLLAAVARHGSITGAAAELLYTPSAVSQQIRKLESETGTPLLLRHPRGVHLTDAGSAVVRRMGVVERELAALDHDLRDLVAGETGTVRWGVFPTIASSLMPDVIAGYRDRRPRVHLHLRSAKLVRLREMLESRDIDAALLWDHPWDPIDTTGVTATPLMQDETVLLAPRGAGITPEQAADLAQLSTADWITRADGHSIVDVLARLGRAAGFEPRVVYAANDWQEVQAMVAAGLGLAVAPQLAVPQLRDGVVTVPLSPAAPARRIQVVRLDRHPPTPADAAWEELLRRVVADVRGRS